MFFVRAAAPFAFAVAVLAPLAFAVGGVAAAAAVPALCVAVVVTVKVAQHRHYAALRKAYAAA